MQKALALEPDLVVLDFASDRLGELGGGGKSRSIRKLIGPLPGAIEISRARSIESSQI